MMEPRVAPMVRRIAMSALLSFTSMIRPETMLSAATSTISIRIRNITLRSTSSTPKNVLLRCRQSDSDDRPLDGLVDGACRAVDRRRAARGTPRWPSRRRPVEEALRLGERHIDEARVELRHADLEHRHDGIALDARRDAERRLRALGRGQRQRVAGTDEELLGQPPPDGDAAGLRRTPPACRPRGWCCRSRGCA